MMMDNIEEINLRGLAPGTISLFIRAKDTIDNAGVHAAFRAYCESEAKNDYTHGMRLLLQNLDYVHSMNALWSRFDEIDERLVALESKGVVVEEPKKPSSFGSF